MADLRAVTEAAGFTGVKTYVASGNLVLESSEGGSSLECTLEKAIEKRFGFKVDVVVRSQQQWSAYARGNPFTQESEVSPNLVMICVGKRAATDEDLSSLKAKAGENERAERRGDALWLYFGNGSGRSKMALGGSKAIWTTRNWRTVKHLAEMLGDPF